MTDEQKKRVEEIINSLAVDPSVIAAVHDIENDIPTTKNQYGRYMAILTPLSRDGNGNGRLYVMAQALIRAGANKEGVSSAVGILNGY